MKKKIFRGSGRKIMLAVFCIILAIIFWFVVEYNVIDNLSGVTTEII